MPGLKSLVPGAAAVLAVEFIGPQVATMLNVASPNAARIVRLLVGGLAGWAVHKLV